VDVLQATYAFLNRLGLVPPIEALADPVLRDAWSPRDGDWLARTLRPIHCLALAIAALGHDVGHPGLSNSYLVCIFLLNGPRHCGMKN
jgi:hypothetical protein